MFNHLNNNSCAFQEELSVKLLEFLESPHATTETLLADKEKVEFFYFILFFFPSFFRVCVCFTFSLICIMPSYPSSHQIGPFINDSHRRVRSERVRTQQAKPQALLMWLKEKPQRLVILHFTSLFMRVSFFP